MKLIVSEEELNDLIDSRAIEDCKKIGNGDGTELMVFTLNISSLTGNLKCPVIVGDVENGFEIKLDNLEEVTENKERVKPISNLISIDDYYEELHNVFRRNVELKNIPNSSTRSLRSGNKAKNKEKLKSILPSFNNDPNRVLMACYYEVYQRVKTSYDLSKNELQYMRGTEAWLNNTINIESMYDRAVKDEQFKELYLKDRFSINDYGVSFVTLYEDNTQFLM